MFVLLEDFVPSGQSLRWQSHQQYYQQEGMAVFLRQEVPYNITSNPCYAEEVVRLFLAQHEAQHQTQSPIQEHSHPLRILELGGGNGVFAYNFFMALERMAPHLDFHYTLSDFSKPLLSHLSTLDAFAHWQKKDVLTLRTVDASQPGSADDLKETEPEAVNRGFDLIIANYLFSTFPTEVLLRQENTWHLEKTRLTAPVTHSVLEQVKHYLNSRNVSAHIDNSHPQYTWFETLYAAQQKVAGEIHNLSRTEHQELFTSLGEQLIQHWHQTLEQKLSNAVPVKTLQPLLDSLCLNPLKTWLNEHLITEAQVERRFFEHGEPFDHPVFLETQPALTPLSYSPQMLRALNEWYERLSPHGIMVISDKAVLPTESPEQVKIARHGGTLSHAIHLDLCEQVLQHATAQTRLTRHAHHPIQTLLAGQQLTPTLEDTFAARWIDHPRNMLSHALLEGGQVLLQSERLEAAYRSLKEALNYRPTDSTLQYFCALCCLNEEKYTNALKILNQPHDDIFGVFNRDILLAEAYRSTGQFEKAIPCYERSMAYGENALSYYQLARCQQALNQKEAALESLKKAHALNPEDEDILTLQQEIERCV